MNLISDSSIRRASPLTVEALQFSPWRRVATWLNLSLMVFFLFAVVIMVNVLAREHPVRLNWTRDRVEELAPDSVARLRSVDREMNILVNRPNDVAAESDKALMEAWKLTVGVVKEFQRLNPYIKVEEAREGSAGLPAWMSEFGGDVQMNTVYLHCRDADQKVHKRTFFIQELYSGDPMTGEITDFHAEVTLVSAVYTMAVARKNVIYYLTGFGERPRQGAAGFRSLGAVFAQLQFRDNVEFRDWDLAARNHVPQDADAVLLAGPLRDATPEQLQALRGLLETGGRLFVSLEPGAYERTPRLCDFLGAWGARPGRGLVVDRIGSYRDPTRVRVSRFEPHPINKDFAGAFVDFPLTTTVHPAAPADGKLKAFPLLRATSESFEDADGNGRQGPEEPRKDLPLAVAVESSPVEKPRMKERPVAKLVVWGSTTALSDENIAFSSITLGYALTSLRWLLELEQAVPVSQKKRIRMMPVNLGPGGAGQIWWITVAIMPSLGILLGVIAWWFRRK